MRPHSALRALLPLLAPVLLTTAGCPKDPPPQPAADAAAEAAAKTSEPPADTKYLDEAAKKVLAEIETLETTKDVTCWTSFRQLDNFISSKEYSTFASIAKINAEKALVRGAWEKASKDAKGPEVTAADLKAAVPLNEQNMAGDKKDKLASFAKDLGLKAYKDYRTTSEHYRIILSVIQDEVVAPRTTRLRPLAADALPELTELATRMALALMLKAGALAQDERTPFIEAPHVRKAKDELTTQFALVNAPAAAKPAAPEETKARLGPLTLKLIQGKVKALQTFNKNTKDLTADVNKLAKVPVTAEALDVWRKDLQSFAHFVAAGYEPMQADNFLSDGQFAEAKLPALPYVDDVHAQNAIMQLFPHVIMPNGDIRVRFEPNPAAPSKTPRKARDVLIKDYEQNGVRDTAIHWLVLEQVHKERPYAMDPFAAEFLSEVVSVMFTYYLRRGEELAGEAKSKEITADIAKKVRDHDYVMTMPKIGAAETVAWTPEQQAKKTAALAKYPAPLFKDTTKESGLPTTTPPFSDLSKAFDIQKVMGAGLAVGDVNRDGYPDVFVAGEGAGKLYLNKGKDAPGKFTDATEAWGVPKDLDDSKQPIFFDMDGDGDLDLLVLRNDKPSLLLKQEPAGKFTDVASSLGLATHKGAHVASVVDYDGDGDLDIYVGYYGSDASNRGGSQGRNLPSMDGRNGTAHQLWKRGPDGKYTDVAKAAGVDDTGWTLAIGAFDYNNDGKMDLFLANDFGEDILYRNKGDGTFESVARPTGTDDRGSGMNVSFTDLNGDGFLDLYVSNIDMFSKNIKVIYPTDRSTLPNLDESLAKTFQYLSGNKLYLNPADKNGKTPFTAVQAKSFEPGERGWGWAAVFFDYENDGDDDMYLSNGWIEGSLSHNQKNQMFVQDASMFYLAPPTSPEAFAGDSRSVVAFDMDQDGDLDLLVNNFRQPLVLLENTQKAGNHSVKLRLKASGLNPNAVGARVTVKAGTKKVLREVSVGGLYMGQDEDVLTVGIGAATKADEITIRWPDGKTQTVKDVEGGAKVQEIKEAP
ncbi:MAG TPA: FG-GAP-like repeat-containing protein [Labilithrix sp.]|nr:FG-GAP-like repeat-containing protein [Labilithrix sp.]